jgi:hypothetical protein
MKAETAIAAQSLVLNFYKYFGGEKNFHPPSARPWRHAAPICVLQEPNLR